MASAKPFLDFFLEAFEDKTLQILLVSAIVSIILGVTVEDPSCVFCPSHLTVEALVGLKELPSSLLLWLSAW